MSKPADAIFTALLVMVFMGKTFRVVINARARPLLHANGDSGRAGAGVACAEMENPALGRVGWVSQVAPSVTGGCFKFAGCRQRYRATAGLPHRLGGVGGRLVLGHSAGFQAGARDPLALLG